MFNSGDARGLPFFGVAGATRVFIQLPSERPNAPAAAVPPAVANHRGPSTGPCPHVVPRAICLAATGRTQHTFQELDQ